jgi:hypothetical protein
MKGFERYDVRMLREKWSVHFALNPNMITWRSIVEPRITKLDGTEFHSYSHGHFLDVMSVAMALRHSTATLESKESG